MTVQIQAFVNGFPNVLLHALLTLLILIIAATLHAMLSPATRLATFARAIPRRPFRSAACCWLGRALRWSC